MSDRRHHPCFNSCEEEIAEISACLEADDAGLSDVLSAVAVVLDDGPGWDVREARGRMLDRISYLRGGDPLRAEEGRS
jgi:hypothetical protein